MHVVGPAHVGVHHGAYQVRSLVEQSARRGEAATGRAGPHVTGAPHDLSHAQELEHARVGLDHHGRGLIFIDDDAPCYVRVIGQDSTKRLELAKLVAKNLTFANAPMTPRPFP